MSGTRYTVLQYLFRKLKKGTTLIIVWMEQAMQLAQNPHVIIATPGRLVDHLEKTKGFNLKTIQFLVLDEADKMLDQNFQVELGELRKPETT